MSKRISIDQTICHGQACIRGTRIPVHQMLVARAPPFPAGVGWYISAYSSLQDEERTAWCTRKHSLTFNCSLTTKSRL